MTDRGGKLTERGGVTDDAVDPGGGPGDDLPAVATAMFFNANAGIERVGDPASPGCATAPGK
jgi:hypothetical protein